MPVIFGLTVKEEFTNPKSTGHLFVVDGYGFQDYGKDLGKVGYYHCNLGWNGKYNAWFNINSTIELKDHQLYLEPQFPKLIYNIMSDDLGGKGREITSGRLWFGGQPQPSYTLYARAEKFARVRKPLAANSRNLLAKVLGRAYRYLLHGKQR
jgi:hypothetical protein